MTVGLYLLLLLSAGYLSVYLRSRYLDFKFLVPFTWLGILLHESAHAAACLIMGGKITGFRVTAKEGRVTHYWPQVPLIGPFFVAVAPLFLGLLILGAVNYFVWHNALNDLSLISDQASTIWQIFISWSFGSLLVVFFLLNIGVMIGPSWDDLKQIWPILLVLLFIHNDGINALLSLALLLVLLNTLFFALLIILKNLWRHFISHR